MFEFKKLMVCAVLSAICLTAVLPTRASASTYTATKVAAVALGMPYHYTLSVQNNALVISGDAPSYLDNGNFQIDLIEPVNYVNPSIDGNGLAALDRMEFDFGSTATQKGLHPTVVKSITRPLSLSSHIAPIITVAMEGKSYLTYDLGNVPKLSLSGLPDGLYNIRTKFSSNWSNHYLYCDDILIVVQGGKASLQVLPTYIRFTYFGDGCMTYEGYTLDPYEVDPSITDEAEGNWIQSR